MSTAVDQPKRPETSVKRNAARLSVVGLLVIVALVWITLDVWTAPLGFVSHVLRGTYASFEGQAVRVPWDMWVQLSDNDTLMIVRRAPTYPLLNSPWGTIMIQRGTGQPTNMARDFDKIARASEELNGYQFQDLHQLSAPKGTVYCWESLKNDSPTLSISCWFDNDTLAASYAGSPDYRSRFYNVIAVVTGARPPEGESL
jgi:hypothetical protein